MKKNMGVNDATVRLILSLLIAWTGVYINSFWGLLALPLLITLIAGFCPLYTLFKIRTNSNEANDC